jgi:RNA recognition motif-containing protein
VIRDRKTNVGKGFCYVQFAEKASVPLALKLKDNELAGRKIRITRAIESLAQKDQPKTKTIIEGNRATRPDQIAKPIERFKKPRLGQTEGKVKKNLNNFKNSLDIKPRLSADGTRIKKPRHVPRVPKPEDYVPTKKHVVFTDVPENKTSTAAKGGQRGVIGDQRGSAGANGIKSRVGSDGKRISKADRLGIVKRGRDKKSGIKDPKKSRVSKK